MQRFKTRPQFQAALAGDVVAKTSHFSLHRADILLAPAEHCLPVFATSDTWIGAMAPKRWAKRAVTRNAIKRQIYIVSVSLSPSLPAAAFLIRLRREFSRQDFVSASSSALKDAVRTQLLILMHSASALK